jgi:outer membrane protein assembly factor BamB
LERPPSNSNRTDAAGPPGPIAELWSLTADARLSQPVVAGETLSVGSHDGTVLAIDVRNGEERWRQSVGDAAFIPQVVAGRVCVPTASAIVALDPTDGREQWRVETPTSADGFDRDGSVVEATLLTASHGIYWIAGEGHNNEENPTLVSIAPADAASSGEPTSATPGAGDCSRAKTPCSSRRITTSPTRGVSLLKRGPSRPIPPLGR